MKRQKGQKRTEEDRKKRSPKPGDKKMDGPNRPST
nr:spore protein [Oceanobacillus halotolerans]